MTAFFKQFSAFGKVLEQDVKILEGCLSGTEPGIPIPPPLAVVFTAPTHTHGITTGATEMQWSATVQWPGFCCCV